MMEEKELDQSWLHGKLECSFSGEFLSHNEQDQSTLNDIVLQGRKVLLNAEFISGNPPERQGKSFLPDNYIPGLEIYPKVTGLYPLDMARKFNATDIRILNPKTSEIRVVNGVRHGQLQAEIYCKLKRLKDIPKKEDIQPITTIEKDNSVVATDLSSRKGCSPNRNSSELMARNGCKPFGSLLNIPIAGGGCFNFIRLGCGGLIGLLLLLGLLTLLLRGCAGILADDDNQNNTDDQEQVEDATDTDQDKMDFGPDVTDSDVTDSDGADSDSKKVDLEPEENDTDQTKIDAVPKKTDSDNKNETKIEFRTIVLSNVQFYTNSSKLMPSSKEDLDKLSLYLLENISTKARIIGFTDSKGDAEENKKLSLSRAQSVCNYLENQGVNRVRLKAIGKGEENPRAPNEDPEGRAMNRRVEIELYSNPTAK